MARKFSEAGIERNKIVQDEHVLQLTDALRGEEGYEIRLTGSVHINDYLFPFVSSSDEFGQTLILDNSGPTSSFSLGFPTASFITASNVYGFSGSNSIKLAETASFALTASTALNVSFEEIVSVTFTNTDTINVVHAFGSNDVVVQVYTTADDDPTQFVQIIPDEVRIVNDASVQVLLSGRQSGYVVVGQSGFIARGSIENAVTASYALNAANTAGYTAAFTDVTSLVVNHNLGSKFVAVTIYDDNDQQIIPRNVTALSSTLVNVQFAGPTTGTIVVK